MGYNENMEKKELTEWIKGLKNVTADSPFEEDFGTLVFRHAQTRRWFGLWLKVPGKYLGEGAKNEFCLNLKCPPELAEMLRQNYKGILPAYHMNKEHWITVRLCADVPEEEIKNLIRLSYDLTSKREKSEKANLGKTGM